MTEPNANQSLAAATEPLKPTEEQRQAFIDAIAPRRDFEPYTVVSVPLIGAAGSHFAPDLKAPVAQAGHLYLKVAEFRLDFDMPNGDLGSVNVPDWLQRRSLAVVFHGRSRAGLDAGAGSSLASALR